MLILLIELTYRLAIFTFHGCDSDSDVPLTIVVFIVIVI